MQTKREFHIHTLRRALVLAMLVAGCGGTGNGAGDGGVDGFVFTPGVTVSPATLETKEGGGGTSFTIVLDSRPDKDVVVPIESSDSSEGTVSPTSVTFTRFNWNAPKLIQVAPVDDAEADGAVMYKINVLPTQSNDPKYDGLDPADVTVTNVDNETAGVTVTTPTGLQVAEAGTTATFAVYLNSKPNTDITIFVHSADSSEGTVAPAMLTFTPVNYAAPQIVTVTGVDDTVADGNQTFLIVLDPIMSTDSAYMGLDPQDVEVLNIDNESPGYTILPAGGLTTTEYGSSAGFSVRLNSEPTADVTIAVSSDNLNEGTVDKTSLTFTPVNWSAPQVVIVTGVDDQVADGNQLYNIVLTATTADARYSTIDPMDVTASNTDNETAGISVLTNGGLAVSEAGASDTFQIVLNSQPTADVTIPITSSDTTEGTVSPASVTFTPSNWSSPQTVTVSGIDDLEADGNQNFQIVTGAATSTDQRYNGINAQDLAVANLDNETRGILVTASAMQTTEAGGTATFKIQLVSQPTADVTIALTSSDTTEGNVQPTSVTFTSVNWNSPQTVTVTGVDDNLADGSQTYRIVTAAATSADANYQGLNAEDVSVTNIDDESAGVLVTASALRTTEFGGTATFTVRLTSQPTADVTIPLSSSDTSEGTVAPAQLVFTSANWNAVQTVTVTGIDDLVADGSQVYRVVTGAATSSDSRYSGFNAEDVSVTNIDNESAGVIVVATGLQTTEAGATTTFTVRLASQPSANVTIGLSSSDTTEGTVSPASLTFTTSNWSAPQTVTITGVDDSLADGSQLYTIVTAPAASTDAGYSGLNAEDVTVTNIDNETAHIIVAAGAMQTTEAGASATFTVRLGSQPSANVTIGLTSSDTTEGTVSPASLTFTTANWASPQTVTVTGVDDDLADGAQAFTILTAAATSADSGYNGLDAEDVMVTNIDNETARILVDAHGMTTTETGGAASFTIRLASQPTANVTIGVTSADTTEGTVAPASVTFTTTNWASPQTVTVTGVDDMIADGAQTYAIVTAPATSADPRYNGLDAEDVSVTNIDNETAGILVITSGGGMQVNETGTSATFQVVLTSQPSGNVTIGLSSSDATEGSVAPAALVFTSANWNAPQTVAVTGVDDNVADGNQVFAIVTAPAVSSDAGYSGRDAENVSVVNNDNETAGIVVTAAGLRTTEFGGFATFTIRLATQPTADVTIPLASSDATEGTVSPASVTFTSGNWNAPQTVTVTGVDDTIADGDQQFLAVTQPATSGDAKYSGMNAEDVNVTNIDNETAGIVVSTSGLQTTEAGGTATFTIALKSQPTASVSIALSSSDTTEGTVSPAGVTFTTANWNAPQTVTVTGVDDSIADGDQVYTIVIAAAVSTDPVYNGKKASDLAITNRDNELAGIVVSPNNLSTSEIGGSRTFTIALSSQPSASVTIGLASSNTNEGTVAPASVTFTTANWNAPQTVAVTPVDDSVADGDQQFFIVTAPAVSTDAGYSGRNAEDVAVTNFDNETAGILISSRGLTTSESGGAASFTIKLKSQPTANVTINLSSSDTTEGTLAPASLLFTAANWNSPQTVTVTGVDDSVADGNQVYQIVTAPAVSTDPTYNGRDAEDLLATNVDNETAGILVTASALTTTEVGGTASFTVRLISQPAANVTVGITSSDTTEGTVAPASLVFTAVNWFTPQTVTVTGVDDSAADGNQVFTIVTAPASSGDTAYNGLNADDVAVTNIDNETAGVLVTASALTTTESGGLASFTVRLTSQPSADVTVGLTSSDTTEGTVAPASLTFTSGNWNLPQTVTITGVDDNAADGNVVYTIVTAAAASGDSRYSGMPIDDVSVTNIDNESANIIVTANTLRTSESGATTSFTVRLASQPSADVIIPIDSLDTTEGTVNQAALTFTTGNWNIAQTVVITGVDDVLADGDQLYVVAIGAAMSSDAGYNGKDSPDLSVTNVDNDSANILVTYGSLRTSETGSGTAVSVVLSVQPTATVTIPVSSSDATEGAVSTSLLTFTTANWSTPQAVVVTGQDDLVADGDQQYLLVFGPASSSDPIYNGKDPSDLLLTNTDNDTPSVQVTNGTLKTSETGVGTTVTLVLTSQPSASVTIPIASSDTSEGTVSAASVTFTTANWNVAQSIAVSGIDDAQSDGDQQYVIQIGPASSADPVYNGKDPADLLVTNVDNDRPAILISQTLAYTTEAGGSTTFSVVLASQPNANVTVPFGSSNTAEGTLSAASLTFTSANWSTPQIITVTGQDDAIADGDKLYVVSVGPSASGDAAYNGIDPLDYLLTNRDNDTPNILVTPSGPLTTTEAGGGFILSVVLTSQPTGNVTIAFSSSNGAEGAVGAPALTFTPGNWNVAQPVTVTGVDDAADDGDKLFVVQIGPATSTDIGYNGRDPSDLLVTNVDND